jgi:hypothetical protein
MMKNTAPELSASAKKKRSNSNSANATNDKREIEAAGDSASLGAGGNPRQGRKRDHGGDYKKSTAAIVREVVTLSKNPLADLKTWTATAKKGGLKHGRTRGQARTDAETFRLYGNALSKLRGGLDANGGGRRDHNLLSVRQGTGLVKNHRLRPIRGEADTLKRDFLAAKREAARLRKLKGKLSREAALNEKINQPAKEAKRPDHLTRQQLFDHHQKAGTLGLYYQMFPEDAPEA